jgi:hypothetical protein
MSRSFPFLREGGSATGVHITPRVPLVLGMFQRRGDMDRAMRVENQERLRTLKAKHGDAVTIFNSHDPVDYENCRCGRHDV